MGIYIKGVEMPDMRQAYIGLTICWDGEVYPFVPPAGHKLGESIANAAPVPPHGRLIDADEFLNRAFGTGLFGEDDMRLLGELVGGSPTIIPAEEDEIPICTKASPASMGIYKKAEEGEI